MRPLLAIVLAVAIICGVQAFISASAGTVVQRAELVEADAKGIFTVELLLTFDAGPDAFALDAEEAPSIVLEQRGKEILRRTETVSSGSVVTAEVEGIVEGKNELYLKTTAADDDPDAVRIVRVRVLRDDKLIVEKYVASEPGMAVEGPIVLDIPSTHSDADEHKH